MSHSTSTSFPALPFSNFGPLQSAHGVAADGGTGEPFAAALEAGLPQATGLAGAGRAAGTTVPQEVGPLQLAAGLSAPGATIDAQGAEAGEDEGGPDGGPAAEESLAIVQADGLPPAPARPVVAAFWDWGAPSAGPATAPLVQGDGVPGEAATLTPGSLLPADENTGQINAESGAQTQTASAAGPGRAAPSHAAAHVQAASAQPSQKASSAIGADAETAASLEAQRSASTDASADASAARHAGPKPQPANPQPANPQSVSELSSLRPETTLPPVSQASNGPSGVVMAGLVPGSGPAAAGATTHVPEARGQAPSSAALIPVAGLAAEITARASEGRRRFEIRLDPPELGRIDVRLDFARDGQLMARLVVDRAETLDLLRRDAASLERALESAGLRSDQSGLQLSLRDHSGGGWQAQDDLPRPDLIIVPDEDVAVREAVQRAYGVLRSLGDGIDIRI